MIKQSSFAEAYRMAHLPSKVALAVSEKPDGSYNLITIEWFMRTSIHPPMFAISIGHTRYSYDCMQDIRYFNLIFPSEKHKELLSLAGSNSGRDMDKFTASGVQHFPGKLHKLPVLSDAVACFECEIVSQIRSGDHTIFIGEVKHSWQNEAESLFYFQNK